MTTETTITTERNGNTEAHQSAGFDLQLPIELELSNPWTISDGELLRIAAKSGSQLVSAYAAGFMAGRNGLDFDINDRRGDEFLSPIQAAMFAGARDGVALHRQKNDRGGCTEFVHPVTP